MKKKHIKKLVNIASHYQFLMLTNVIVEPDELVTIRLKPEFYEHDPFDVSHSDTFFKFMQITEELKLVYNNDQEQLLSFNSGINKILIKLFAQSLAYGMTSVTQLWDEESKLKFDPIAFTQSPSVYSDGYPKRLTAQINILIDFMHQFWSLKPSVYKPGECDSFQFLPGCEKMFGFNKTFLQTGPDFAHIGYVLTLGHDLYEWRELETIMSDDLLDKDTLILWFTKEGGFLKHTLEQLLSKMSEWYTKPEASLLKNLDTKYFNNIWSLK